MFPALTPQVVLEGERASDGCCQFITVDITRRVVRQLLQIRPAKNGTGLIFASEAISNVYVLYRLNPALSARVQAAIATLRREARG